MVHFNVHIDPTYADVDAEELKDLLKTEIVPAESLYFRNMTIDITSLEVTESDKPIHSTTTTRATTATVQESTKEQDPPRKCSKIDLGYCAKLPYNRTTYPNVLGHKNSGEVQDDVIAFRELVDAECYNYAYDFVCRILQPLCRKGSPEDEMMLPCRSYCRDFMVGCGSRLLPRVKNVLDCARFPEFRGLGSCATKPGMYYTVVNLVYVT